jgi:hypothetical protein
MSELAPGGQPEAALQIADQNMYKAKKPGPLIDLDCAAAVFGDYCGPTSLR